MDLAPPAELAHRRAERRLDERVDHDRAAGPSSARARAGGRRPSRRADGGRSTNVLVGELRLERPRPRASRSRRSRRRRRAARRSGRRSRARTLRRRVVSRSWRELERYEGAATIEKVAVALPPARVRLPVVGHLRRPRLLLRLRPLRRAAQAERQGGVAAVDGPGARGHRPARLGDHPQPEGLGRLGARRRLLRPARRLPHLQAPLPRRPHRRRASAASGRPSARARRPTAT